MYGQIAVQAHDDGDDFLARNALKTEYEDIRRDRFFDRKQASGCEVWVGNRAARCAFRPMLNTDSDRS